MHVVPEKAHQDPKKPMTLRGWGCCKARAPDQPPHRWTTTVPPFLTNRHIGMCGLVSKIQCGACESQQATRLVQNMLKTSPRPVFGPPENGNVRKFSGPGPKKKFFPTDKKPPSFVKRARFFVEKCQLEVPARITGSPEKSTF